MRFVPTICPHCGTGCGMLLVVENERVVGVEPWARSPVSEGRLCIKGWTSHEFVHHPDRLTTPLIRRGDKLEPATWEDALSYITSKLQEIKAAYGPDAIGFRSSSRCTNEENYLFQKLARAFGSPNVDNCARV